MNNELEICPFCGNEVKKNIQKCQYCGEWLNYHCPFYDEIISKDSTVCPECKTQLKEGQKNKRTTVFKFLAIFSLIYCFLINLIFSIIGIGAKIDFAKPENEDIIYGIAGIYVILTFIPYYVPIISLCAGFERKFSIIATVLNNIGQFIFVICIVAYSFTQLI